MDLSELRERLSRTRLDCEFSETDEELLVALEWLVDELEKAPALGNDDRPTLPLDPTVWEMRITWEAGAAVVEPSPQPGWVFVRPIGTLMEPSGPVVTLLWARKRTGKAE